MGPSKAPSHGGRYLAGWSGWESGPCPTHPVHIPKGLDHRGQLRPLLPWLVTSLAPRISQVKHFMALGQDTWGSSHLSWDAPQPELSPPDLLGWASMPSTTSASASAWPRGTVVGVSFSAPAVEASEPGPVCDGRMSVYLSCGSSWLCDSTVRWLSVRAPGTCVACSEFLHCAALGEVGNSDASTPWHTHCTRAH